MSTPSTASKSQGTGRIFPGWRMLGLAWIHGLFSPGIAQSGLSLFFLPLRRQLEISSTFLSLVFGLGRIQQGAGDLLFGRMVDRVGSRPLILFGGLTTALGLILLSFIESYWQLVLIFVGVIALARPASHGTSLLAIANHWFRRRKALALSIFMTSGSAGGALVIPLLALGLAHLGWRDTLRASGGFLCLLTLVTFLLIRSKPEDLGLEPDGGPPKSRGRGLPRPVSSGPERDFSVSQPMRTRPFWFLLVGITGRIFVTDALAVHQIPMLVWKGISEQTAAFVFSIVFLLVIPLRLALGMT